MNYKNIALIALLLPIASYGKSNEVRIKELKEAQFQKELEVSSATEMVYEYQTCFDLLRSALLAQVEQTSAIESNAKLLIEEAVKLCSKCCMENRHRQAIHQAPEEDSAGSALNDARDVITKEKLIRRFTEHASYPRGCEPDRDHKKVDDKKAPTLNQVACEYHNNKKIPVIVLMEFLIK